jgi:hypothetical protein
MVRIPLLGRFMRGGQAQDNEAPSIVAYINGQRHELPAGRGEATLLQYLRGEDA